MIAKTETTGGTLYLNGKKLCEVTDMTIYGDQWEMEGDCTKCRRKKYCSKPCRKRREKRANEWDEARAMGAAMIFERMIKGGMK